MPEPRFRLVLSGGYQAANEGDTWRELRRRLALWHGDEEAREARVDPAVNRARAETRAHSRDGDSTPLLPVAHISGYCAREEHLPCTGRASAGPGATTGCDCWCHAPEAA